MALLSFRGISTPSLTAQGEQRRSSFFNIERDYSNLGSGPITIDLEGSFSACLTLNQTNLGNAASTTVTSYGSGYTITANCSGVASAAINISSISNVTVQNGTLAGAGAAAFGVLVNNPAPSAALMSNITIKSMTIGGFYCTVNCSVNWGGEIFVQRFSGDGSLSNINILNNVVGGTAPNSLDDYGIVLENSGATRAGMATFAISGNTVANLGGTGIGDGSGVGIVNAEEGTVSSNIAHDLGGNNTHCGGPSAFGTTASSNIVFSYNEAYNVQPISFSGGCDWDGLDVDTGSSNIVYEYNYVHNVYGACQLFYNQASSGYSGNVARYNVYEDCGSGDGADAADACIAVNSNSEPGAIEVYNNTCNSSTGYLVSILGAGSMTGYLANNILFGNETNQRLIYSPSATTLVPINNDYYQEKATGFDVVWSGTTYTSLASWQAAGGDPGGVTSNPIVFNPGNGGFCASVANPMTCPVAYKLDAGSPLIGAGVDLTKSPYSLVVGSSDYFGNTMPSATGTGYNIGADGAVGYTASCAQASAFLVRTSGLSSAARSNYSNLLCSMAASGLGCGSTQPTNLDALWVLAAPDSTTELLNLCSPSYPLVMHGTSTFTPNVGSAGNSSTGYLDTQLVPSTFGGNFSLNSASFGVFVQTNRTTSCTSNFVEMGADNVGTPYSNISPLTTGACWAYSFINDNAPTYGTNTSASARGIWTVSRTSNTSEAIYLNGSAISPITSPVTSTALSSKSFWLEADDYGGSISNASTDQLSLAFVGPGLTAVQVTLLSILFNNFAAALGINVY